MKILKIENLHVTAEGKEILKGVNLELDTGKVNALMGKNGSGKSTLSYTIMGHPKYKITKGKIYFNGKDITKLTTEERSQLGIFLSFQQPREIEGVTITNLVKKALIQRGEKNTLKTKGTLKKNADTLEVKEELLKRHLNKGFSGGEKKKMEILQLLSLNPKFAILDETDSGLDIDSLKTISKGINSFITKETGALIITHYKRILENLNPDKVFIMNDGKIIKKGDIKIVDKLEEEGYKFLEMTNKKGPKIKKLTSQKTNIQKLIL